MKTPTMSPALEITEEKALTLSKSASPKLTYHQAVNSYFVAGPGQIYRVAECSIEQFTALVAGCVITAKNPKVCAGALVGLDYSELLSRWYALDTLRVYGAKIRLYPSTEGAEGTIH